MAKSASVFRKEQSWESLIGTASSYFSVTAIPSAGWTLRQSSEDIPALKQFCDEQLTDK